MFVPLTWEEFIFQAKDMMWVMDKHISSVMTYKDTPVGALICIPDLNPLLEKVGSKMGFTTPFHFIKHKRNSQRAVIIFYSVNKEFHGKGINALLLNRTFSQLQQRGYKTCGGTWIADSNIPSLKQIDKMSAEKMHKLHLFTKEI